MDTHLAIVELGGKQHLVTPGAKIVVNRLDAAEGAALKLPDMLSDQKVEAKVVSHSLGQKIHGLKFKPKTRYLKRYGHRQTQTVVEVISIGQPVAPISSASAAVAKPSAPKKPVAKKVAPKKVVTNG